MMLCRWCPRLHAVNSVKTKNLETNILGLIATALVSMIPPAFGRFSDGPPVGCALCTRCLPKHPAWSGRILWQDWGIGASSTNGTWCLKPQVHGRLSMVPTRGRGSGFTVQGRTHAAGLLPCAQYLQSSDPPPWAALVCRSAMSRPLRMLGQSRHGQERCINTFTFSVIRGLFVCRGLCECG